MVIGYIRHTIFIFKYNTMVVLAGQLRATDNITCGSSKRQHISYAKSE